ncbi:MULTISPECIES: M1 family metallopeptidase [Galbibacter]|uniref:Aminopeptidase N n=1 Tax=Galbibacter pacificus TaxID=2996052 RepID=A0ABT6FQH8_9FLAO|nr:M1 family metallopeptidase [Galbibacter pacificus]MDG3582008.1 M1 family metallopeptidase [Galbibacter pacificus]MDG3585518.1 M1 family metallopeptidase [Galbibacter pacificus]
MKLYISAIFLVASFFGLAQQTAYIDVKKADIDIKIIPEKEQVSGNVVYSFEIIKAIDSMIIDAKQMQVSEVFLNDKPVDFTYNKTQIILNHSFNKKDLNTFKIKYLCNPKKAMYFISSEENGIDQVWTQGQGKYTSNWLPSFDDMNEKIEFDMSISVPQSYGVVANGKLKTKKSRGNLTTWEFDMKNPMSSYLLALVIGNYKIKEDSAASGIPLEMYYNPHDKDLVAPTYRYSKKIFDYLETEIGVSFPWQNYKQVPVKDFLYAGMENTSLTIFSNSYMVDSIGYTDKNYINVNAHELAHQWFGDLVTEENSTHHWLQEGFATYFALLAEREIFGDDYFYVQLFHTAKQLEELSNNGGESLLDPHASSLTFYQRGAWAIFALRNLIGDRAFKKSIKKYLNDYAFKNANTNDFINIASAKSQTKLEDFVQTWFVDKKFPIAEAQNLLKENTLAKELLRVDKMDKTGLLSYAEQHPEIYIDTTQTEIVGLLLKKLKSYSVTETQTAYKKAINSNNIKNRQAVAMYLDTVPTALQKSFESLLKDKSYVTIENALMKLWVNFPQNRNQYLNTTEGIVGFKDKNIETLWLTLALITPAYKTDTKMQYYQRLVSYTSPYQHFEVRQHAFEYLFQIQAFNEESLKNLIQACKHPVWQFSKFSKGLLTELLKNEDYRMVLKNIMPQLDKTSQSFLSNQLK